MNWLRLTARCFGVLQHLNHNGGSITFQEAFKLDQRFLHACYLRGFIGLNHAKHTIYITIEGEAVRLSYLKADIHRRDITRPLARAFNTRSKIIQFKRSA